MQYQQSRERKPHNAKMNLQKLPAHLKVENFIIIISQDFVQLIDHLDVQHILLDLDMNTVHQLELFIF